MEFQMSRVDCGILCEVIDPEERIVLPDTVTRIIFNPFKNCLNTKEITLPSSLATIGSNRVKDEPLLFQSCPKLEKVNLSEGLVSIGTTAFNGCEGIAEITLPASVERVGNRAFAGCKQLKRVVILGDPTAYSTTAFQKCPAIQEVLVSPKYAPVARILFDEKVKFFDLDGKPIPDENSQKVEAKKKGGVVTKEQELIAMVEKSINPAKLLQWAAKMKIDAEALKKVKLVGGKKAAPQEAVLFVIHTYMQQMTKLPAYNKDTYKSLIGAMSISEPADEIARALDRNSLLSVLREKVAPSVEGEEDMNWFTFDVIWGGIPKDAKKKGWRIKEYNDFVELIEDAGHLKFMNFDRLAPYCRYADEQSISIIVSFTERMIKSHGQDGRKLSIPIRSAMLLSDTRAAAEYLDRYGQLDIYAKMRGTAADALRNGLLSDAGLDASGMMQFDL